MRALVPLLFVFAALSCASRGELQGDTFVRDEIRYKVAPPEGWEQVRLEGADLAWFREELGASLLMNSHCQGVDDAPLSVLTNHLLFGMTDREVLEQRELEVSRRAALESRVRARLDGVERRLAILVLKKDGCVYDLVLDASPARFAQALPAFERARDNFDVLTRSSD